MQIREFIEKDFSAVWPIFHEIVRAETSYAFDADTSKEEAYRKWISTPLKTFVVESNRKVLASYYIKPNLDGPGAHICNCGYMVAADARGQGIASLMCQHSLDEARRLGFKAMQFNCVVSSNAYAIQAWEKHGFRIIGTVPLGFKHRELGFVDTYIMHQQLG